jgi:transposase
MGIATAEVRQRAIEAYDSDKGTQSDIARMFNVDIRTFQRWLSCFRQTGRTAPLPRGHRHATFEGDDLERLDQLITEHPDATLEELKDMSATPCSIMAVKRAADRLGYRFKKNAARQRARA